MSVRKILKSLLLASVGCVLLPPTLAASISWSGTQSNAWSEPLNWGGTVPTTADIAVFTGNPLFQPLNNDTGTVGVSGLNFSSATVSFTVRNAGTMTIGNSGITNTSTLAHSIVNTGILTLSGIVDPHISIENDESATLNLGISSLSNLSVVNNGALDMSSASTTVTIGSLSGSGAITGSHTLVVKPTGQGTISGVINIGTQQFVMAGSGTLTFTGTNNSTGNTRIDSGTFIVDEGASFAGGLEINGGILIFNRSSSSSPLIPLSFDKGTLLVGGDQSHSNAVLHSNVTINQTDGGVIGGFGQIMGNVSNQTGTLSPGASVGTLTINGNYTQTGGGTYLVELSSDGNTVDFTHVTGTANLGGTLKFNLGNGFLPAHSYNILDATSVTGTFGTVTDTSTLPFTFFNGPLNTSSVVYTTTGVSVTMPTFSASAFGGAASTPNQIAMSQYLLATNGDAPIAALIAGISTATGFQNAMDQLSGATYANQQWQLAQVGGWFTRQLSDRMSFYPESHDVVAAGGEESEYTTDEEAASSGSSWSLWVTPYGSSAKLDSDSNASGLDTTTGGLALGMDFPFAANQVKLGIAVASSYFDSDVTGNEDGSDTGWLYQVGLYGQYRMGSWNLAANADVGMTDQFDTTRNIVDATAGTTATVYGNYDALVFSQAAKLSYDGLLGQQNHVRPFIGVVHQQVNADSFTETGATGYTLAVDSSDYNSLKSQLGTSISIPISVMTFVGNVAWQHEFLDTAGNVDAHASSITSVTPNPSIAGVDVGTDSALVKAGFVLFQTDRADLTVLYEGVLSDAYTEHGGKIQLNFNVN